MITVHLTFSRKEWEYILWLFNNTAFMEPDLLKAVYPTGAKSDDVLALGKIISRIKAQVK